LEQCHDFELVETRNSSEIGKGIFFQHSIGFKENFKPRVIKFHNSSMQHWFYDAVRIADIEWRKSGKK